MSSEISMLEQAWLQAETIADKARYEAMALDEVLRKASVGEAWVRSLGA